MKLADVCETQDYGSLPKEVKTKVIHQTVDWLKQNGTKWAAAMGGRHVIHGTHEGQDIFGLVEDNNIIALGMVVDAGQNYELRLITNTTGKGGNFYPMMSLLFTIKEYIGKPIIDYGSQSSEGQRFAKALAKHGQFTLSWVNMQTHEKNPYDPTADKPGLKPYRDNTQTDWRIVIEHTTPGSESFPRDGLTPFGTPQDFFTEEYSVWLENYKQQV